MTAAELHPPLETQAPARNPKKRNYSKRAGKGRKRSKTTGENPILKVKKPNEKLLKLYKKRAREYHSDSDHHEDYSNDDEETDLGSEEEELAGIESSEDAEEDGDGEGAGSGTIIKFAEGSRAFRTAFVKIMKYHLPNDPLGPILSAHKKLVAEKLADEDTEQKVKREAKKKKHLANEKGHARPANFLDTKEKYLISVATKGVVKLFNAVNKAQNSQKGLNPSKSKDAKELAKLRKEAFLSEIKRPTSEAPTGHSSKVSSLNIIGNKDEPGWAPLRDSYMVTTTKLKHWDKLEDPAEIADSGNIHGDSSDDD